MNDMPEGLLPLYRLYHKNQNNIVSREYIDDETVDEAWTTGGYKEYERRDGISPPEEQSVRESDVLNALANRASFSEATRRRPISKDELFTVLESAYGVDSETEKRPIPSPGQLYPLEIYPLVIDSPDIEEGLYHYNPGENVLERPNDPEYTRENFGPFDTFVRQHWTHIGEENEISVIFFVTAVPSRSTVKYGERGYLFSLIETGSLIQAVQLAASEVEIGTRPYAGFRYDLVEELLGIASRKEELLITSIALANPDKEP
jgi:SagB-type dehydrogenase family enzyme